MLTAPTRPGLRPDSAYGLSASVLTSSVIATTALLDSDSTLLEQLAAGEHVAALAVPWSTGPDAELPTVRLEGGRLTGTITSVAGAIEADVLLVVAGSDLYGVDVSAVTVTPRVCLAMTRQLADVTLDGVSGALVLADAGPAVRRALDSGAALMASEQLGLARWCLETTVGDPDATVATSIAQAYNSDLAVRAAEEAVQLHGGIGMTWEHPTQRT